MFQEEPFLEQSAPCPFFSCDTLLHWSPAGVVMHRIEEDNVIEFQFSVALFWGCDFHNCILAPPCSPQMRREG